VTIVEFLTARLNERAAAAEAATPGDWRATGDDIIITCDDPHWDGACAANACGADADHIALNDPQRALREVKADRAIIARYETLRNPKTLLDRVLFPPLASMVLACIWDRAEVWSDHPDYPPGHPA
jgi:hypothetical protein